MALRFSIDSLAAASARRPWLVIGAWVLVLIGCAVLIATSLGDALTAEVRLTNNPESQRAESILKDWRGEDHDQESIVVRSDSLTVDEPAFRTQVESITAQIQALKPDAVLDVMNYYSSQQEAFVSADRHTRIIPLVMAGNETDAADNIDKVIRIVEDSRTSDFEVLIGGPASINHTFEEVSATDLRTGEAIGIPIALIVLVIVFGSFTSAIIPIVLGIVSIVIAIGMTAVFGQVFRFSFFVTNVITMMGLAVGIDYSLFIVSRFREEREHGLEKMAAIRATGATASRAVFFSGMTVVFALLGMFLIPTTIFRSLGAGAVIVVVVSMLVSLTLLPAILGLLGDRVNSLRVPILGRALERRMREGVSVADSQGGFWDRITHTVMRFPVISLAVALVLMLVLAVPYLDLKTGSAGVSTLPHTTDSYKAFTVLRDEFNMGHTAPVEIVLHDDDVTRADVQAGITGLQHSLAEDPLYGPAQFEVNPDKSIGLITLAINADPTGDAAVAAVRKLRGEIIPRAFAGADTEVLVTGRTATQIDYFDTTSDYTPVVFVFVLALSFILLTVVFRSLIVPLKAILMNLLSVGAAYGLLVAVFQKGYLNEVLGFQQVDVIEAWIPLWTFSILFGLSMDYHVFLLSRIRERFIQTGDNTESVMFGVRSTAGIITGAALIMASVFAGFALGDLVMFQQMGFGLGVAVLLDATIVRSVLVPAAMQLLGKANWYLPSVLKWLPEVSTESPTERGRAGDIARA